MPRQSQGNYGIYNANWNASLNNFSGKELRFSADSKLSCILEAIKNEFPGVQLSELKLTGNQLAGSGGAGMTDGGFVVGMVAVKSSG